MQQITLVLDSDEVAVPLPALEPQQKKRLIVVMAKAIIAVQHHHQDNHRGERAHDPDRCER